MRVKMVATVLAVLLYIPVGLAGADCLAGVLFDVTNNRPTGQRGLYSFWRTGADVMSTGTETGFKLLQNQ